MPDEFSECANIAMTSVKTIFVSEPQTKARPTDPYIEIHHTYHFKEHPYVRPKRIGFLVPDVAKITIFLKNQ